jgi:hypothetical protein
VSQKRQTFENIKHVKLVSKGGIGIQLEPRLATPQCCTVARSIEAKMEREHILVQGLRLR